MGCFLRAMAVSAAAVLLSACNIEISLLGEGQVRSDSAETSSCDNGNQCLSVGYNQRVELTAEAAPGYQFAGWSGACSGADRCVLRSSSDLKVAAVFKTRDAFVPLMNYSAASFLSGPWPSDIKRRVDGRLDLNGFPFDNGVFYSGIKAMAGKRQGFARNGSLFIPVATHSDVGVDNPVMQFDAAAGQRLQLLNLEPGSAHYLQRVPAQVRLHRDANLSRDSLLQVLPADGYGLEANSRYAVILFAATEPYLFNLPVTQAAAMQRIVSSGGEGELGRHWQLVRDYVSQHTPYTAESVAAFSVFTTQAESNETALVKSFLQQQPFQQELASVRYGGRLGPSCDDSNAMLEQSELHELTLTLPSLIQGKPPFIVAGGKLNINSNTELEATGLGIDAKFWLAVPCDDQPVQSGYPTEIFAMGTAITLADFADAGLIDNANHGALKVYLAAPYTADRIYQSGLANIDFLEPILGVTSAELLPALGDFNPLNLNAVEPQYLQYASDMVVTLEVIKRLENFLADGNLADSGLMPERVRVDPDNITFAGYSLGALAAIHASRLTDEIKNLILIAMPRVNIEHFNNILEYLEYNFLGDSGMSALQALLGFDYPAQLSDPQLNAVQTAIDPLDPTNFLTSLGRVNLLLVTSDYNNPLHGKSPSYNFARAVDLRFGIQPVVEYIGDSSYPFEQYIDSPAELFGTELEGFPLRVLAAEYNAGALVNTFTQQMKWGRLSTAAGYYGY